MLAELGPKVVSDDTKEKWKFSYWSFTNSYKHFDKGRLEILLLALRDDAYQ